jgi:hypothetical protein
MVCSIVVNHIGVLGVFCVILVIKLVALHCGLMIKRLASLDPIILLYNY